MFKVLVIAYYFPPMGLSGVQRTLKFVKYMPETNWEPTVITSGATAYYAHDVSLMKEANEANIRILRTEGKDPNSVLSKMGTVKMPREFIRKNLSRISKAFWIPDNKKSWSKQAYHTAEDLLKKEDFDAIFVSVPPFSPFMMAAKLTEKFDVPLFVDYRDLWHGNHFAFYPTPYHSYKHKKMEYQALKAAERVIVVNRKIKEKILTTYKFLTFEDIIIIPHGFDPKDFENIEPYPKPHKKMILTYSGIFYETITPRYLLKAFKKLTLERPDIAANIELNFVGHLRKENRRLIKRLKLQEFVKDYGYLTHKEAVRRLLSSDILWFMIGNSRNADKISVGKLFEYIGSRKPIFAMVPEGASRTTSIEYDASFICYPDDVEEIKNKLIEIHSRYKQNRLPKPDEEFVLKHNRRILTERLTKQFQFFLKTEV